MRNSRSYGFAHAYDQVGVPASLNADASLGFSRMAYQSSYIAPELRMAHQSSYMRVVRPSSHASHTATQRGKVGFCVNCALATHIAVPIFYEVGAHDWPKSG